ncbi:hypothetical protein Dsin_028520 [Dipteronia sinensis]|uniref:Uncharacterized protein n=1 Tax=Dipteronia sinensis TaxID=43782 RepID=A0AAD9ZR03_9ROSI|nr:hypothetical protein Dsin_028520 [Dipteronia sinensis]
MNPQTQLVSYPAVCFDDTYVLVEVFFDLDLPPVFDEDESDDESGSCENVVSGGFNSQGWASFHHRLGMMNCQIRGRILSSLERMTQISLKQRGNKIGENVNSKPYRLRPLGNIRTADILNVKHPVPYNGDPALEDEEVLNSRQNSVQPVEDDAERMASSYGWRIRIWVAWDNQIWAELRGPLQRANGVGFSNIIYFRKAQDKPNINYEDFIFCNGLQ